MAKDQYSEEADAAAGAPQMLSEAQERLAASERQLDDTVTLLKQTQADFENYQKRAARDRESERKHSIAPLARDLLPALDNLQRAMDAARQVGESGPLVQGVAATQVQIVQILGRYGITPIEAQDQPFDPNRHEAVMQKPSADHPPGTVVQVLQGGFMIHDRVLRPASVVVSAAEA
jgi:molecular chaperone GrpE